MPKLSPQLARNIRLFYLATFLESSFYIDAIYVVFGTHYLHLDYLRAGSLVFIGLFASIVLDFLGGVTADRIGRKAAQLCGLAVQFVGFVPYLFSRNYAVLLMGGVAYGAGSALSSNTLQALIYEQTKDEGRTVLYQRFNALSQVWTFVGLASSGLIGGVAYALNPRLPYMLMLISLGGAFAACAAMHVPGRVEREAAAAAEHPTDVVRTALRTFAQHRGLGYFVIVNFFMGVADDLLFSYYQPFYLTFGVTAAALGVLYAVFRAVSAGGSYAMHRLPDRIDFSVIQLASIASVGLTVLLMLLLPYPAVLVAPLIAAVGFGFNFPALRLYVNRHASNSARAATLSFGTAAMNLGVALGFVGSFWMADHFAPPTVLRVILLATSVAFLLRLMTFRAGLAMHRHGRVPQPAGLQDD